MEADATASPNPPLVTEETSPEDPAPASSTSSSTADTPAAAAAVPAPPGAREVAAAMEAVERDAVAITESYASLFASLRLALSNVTSTSSENMQCLGDVVGRLQESALEASSKGNKYINSCLRLNEELRGLESLAMQLHPTPVPRILAQMPRILARREKVLRKNVDSLDLAVGRLLRLP